MYITFTQHAHRIRVASTYHSPNTHVSVT